MRRIIAILREIDVWSWSNSLRNQKPLKDPEQCVGLLDYELRTDTELFEIAMGDRIYAPAKYPEVNPLLQAASTIILIF
jgi:hypothetical protein